MNYKWNYIPASEERQEEAKRLANELGINPILGQFLLDRGISSVSEAKRFFRPQLSDLHDPFLYTDTFA